MVPMNPLSFSHSISAGNVCVCFCVSGGDAGWVGTTAQLGQEWQFNKDWAENGGICCGFRGTRCQTQTDTDVWSQTSHFHLTFISVCRSLAHTGEKTSQNSIMKVKRHLKLTWETITQQRCRDEGSVAHYCWDFCYDIQKSEIPSTHFIFSISAVGFLKNRVLWTLCPENAYSVRCVLRGVIFNPIYLLVLIKCGMFAATLALFRGDKAAECSRSSRHHEKQSAVQDKG